MCECARYGTGTSQGEGTGSRMRSAGRKHWTQVRSLTCELRRVYSCARMHSCVCVCTFETLCVRLRVCVLSLATGTVAHTALERLFTLPPPQRTAAAAEDLFRATWAKLRLSEKFRPLFFKPKDSTEGTPDASSSSMHVTSLSAAEWEHDREKEAAWGQKSLQTLRTYFEMENPARATRTRASFGKLSRSAFGVSG
eukprot:2897935-Pleurochrysis_carterae.AAC.1